MKLIVPREEFSELTLDLLKKGNKLRLKAFGNSMYPTIRSGEALWIEPFLEKDPAVGEVVFFSNDCGKMVAHRLCSKFASGGAIYFKARGDLFFSGEDQIPKKNVYGKVVAIERNGRRLNLELKKPTLGDLLKGFLLLQVEGARKILHSLFVQLQKFPFYPFLARVVFSFWPIGYQIVPYRDYFKHSETIAQLYHFPPHWRAKVHKKAGPVKTWALAFVGQSPAGILTLTHPGDKTPPFEGYWFWGMFVRTRFRRLGIGKKLVSLLLEVAASEGAKEVGVLVFEEDTAARRFYQNLGFEPFAEERVKAHLAKVDSGFNRLRLPLRKIL